MKNAAADVAPQFIADNPAANRKVHAIKIFVFVIVEPFAVKPGIEKFIAEYLAEKRQAQFIVA